MRAIRAIREWLCCHLLLAIPAYFRAQALLCKKIEDSKRSYDEECQELGQFVPNLDQDVIQRHQESAAKRLGSIEDKARANLLGITIGVAVLFSGFNLAVGGGSATLVPGLVRVSILILFAIAVCYFLTGGIMALKALRLRPLFTPSLREEATASQHMRVVQAVWALEQNERTALMRTNALSVSFDGIRNGVISLAAAVVLLAIAVLFADSGSPILKPVDDLTPNARVDSVQPGVSTPNQTNSPASSRADPPFVVQDSAALTETVDTLP